MNLAEDDQVSGVASVVEQQNGDLDGEDDGAEEPTGLEEPAPEEG